MNISGGGVLKHAPNKANAINLMIGSSGLNFGKMLFFVWNPFKLDTVNTAVSFLRIKKNQMANKGIRVNSHKNSGLLNSKLVQFIFFHFIY